MEPESLEDLGPEWDGVTPWKPEKTRKGRGRKTQQVGLGEGTQKQDERQARKWYSVLMNAP